MKNEKSPFELKRKIGISISVDEENLNKLRKFLKDSYKENIPLSSPFDVWLSEFVVEMKL